MYFLIKILTLLLGIELGEKKIRNYLLREIELGYNFIIRTACNLERICRTLVTRIFVFLKNHFYQFCSV